MNREINTQTGQNRPEPARMASRSSRVLPSPGGALGEGNQTVLPRNTHYGIRYDYGVDVLAEAGFTPDALTAVDRLMVGAGGFVRELLTYTAGESTLKGETGQRLSAADAAVDLLLRERLTAMFPGCSGYSEEGGEFGERSSGLHVRWSLDPLDGTRPALLGGAYAVSAGALLLDDDHPLAALGWVYVPNLGSLYRGTVSRGASECLRNGLLVRAPQVAPALYPNHYMAVGSDWRRIAPRNGPFKFSAAGATAVHLTQFVHAGADVAAVGLSRYRSYDAAGGVVVAAAGGGAIHLLQPGGIPEAEPTGLLEFLHSLDCSPADFGPRAVVATPEVIRALRLRSAEAPDAD